jgi:hypothetical protein
LGEGKGFFVREACLVGLSEASAEIGVGGVSEVITGQFAASQQSFDEKQACLRAFVHGNRHSAVQFDDRGGLQASERGI